MHIFKIFKYLLFSRANKSTLLSLVLKATYFLLDVPSVIKWSAVINNTWVVSSFFFFLPLLLTILWRASLKLQIYLFLQPLSLRYIPKVGIAGSKEGTSILMPLMPVAEPPSGKTAPFTPPHQSGQLCLWDATCTKALRWTRAHWFRPLHPHRSQSENIPIPAP